MCIFDCIFRMLLPFHVLGLWVVSCRPQHVNIDPALRVSFPPSTILREEVKYVHTDADLLAMEKAARGHKDIVLGYVSSLGTQGTNRGGGRMILRKESNKC